jgi:hypothetical protein
MRIALMSLESLTGKEHVQFLGSWSHSPI